MRFPKSSWEAGSSPDSSGTPTCSRAGVLAARRSLPCAERPWANFEEEKAALLGRTVGL